MTVPGSANPLLLRSAAPTAYQVSRSLRFNGSVDSSYLSRTPGSAGSRTTWTWSAWVKRSNLAPSGYQSLFTSTTSGNETLLYFDTSNRLNFYNYSTSYLARKITTAVFRDPSSWYHIVLTWDTTNATAGDRVRIYVNGARQTAFDTSTDAGSSEQSTINNTIAHMLGSYGAYSNNFFDGYLADIYFLDGTATTPSSFAETDATTGQWVPKLFSGSYGTNGFKLTFADNSNNTAATLGADTSGNGNNWTPNNLSVTAGAGNDSLVDTPTSYGTDTGAGGEVRGNYCTLNPLGTAGATPTNGNLSVSSSSTVGNRISTFFLTSGKWYWEGSGNGYVGAIVGRGGESFTGSISGTGSKAIGWWEGGPVYWDGGDNGGSATFTSTDVIGIALDMDAGNIKFYKNNSLIYTITFGSGTVPNLSSGVFPAYNVGASTKSVDLNFGQRPFAYTAPSGFKALCDTNLPAPVVAKPNTVFDVIRYTGNGSTQTIPNVNTVPTTLGFSPDFVWIKARNLAYWHRLIDSVRGAQKFLYSNDTSAEGTSTANDIFTSFDSAGFTLGGAAPSADGLNQNSEPYVAWCWDAGTSTVTNTAGSITSSVRANASAGFSIITFTAPSSGNFTVGHGLGVAPQLLIIKGRDSNSSGYDWRVFHSSVCDTVRKALSLNGTGAVFTSGSDMWGSALPTSTVFGATANNTVGANGTAVAYAFSPVAGYSSFGTYTANGSTDGPFVYTGFRPRFILFKRTDSVSSGDWVIYDTARDPYNVCQNYLLPNTSGAEGVYANVDYLSNGFKLRSNASINTSGGTWIWAAWAESPFQYARAR